MKYVLVLQHTQEDCGAACLASIAKHYGRNFSLNRVREAVGTGQLGTTLLGLRRGTATLGFHARSAVASPELIDRINNIPLPAILHWQGKHWVLLYGKRRDSYVIADPAIGIRYLSKSELLEGWSDRVILLVQPDSSRFYDQDEDRPARMGQFLQRVMPYGVVLLEAIVCVTLIGLLSLVSPLFIQILTDEVLIQGDTQLLLGIVIGVIVLYLVRSGLSLVADILIANFAQRLELGLVLEFGRQILQLPLTYYETRRSGEVISRLRDIEEINRLIAQVIVSLPSSILIAIASLGLMLFYSWKLALLSGMMAIVMLLSTIGLKPILQQKTQRAMVLETENQGVLVEAFKGALTLKSTAAAPQFWDELQSRFGRLAYLLYDTTKIAIYNSTFSSLVADIGNTLLLGLGGWLVLQQELSIGQLLAFTALNRNVTELMDELVNLIDDWIRVKTANARLQEVVMTLPETQNDDRKAWVNLPDNAAIVCQNLHFHYPGRVELLKDFSLEVPGGKAIALIGKSGCGKSTLAKLIAGLYFPQAGNIRLANYNLQDLALDCVRQQVVLVPQEAHFWSRSILDNFRMGNPHLSFEQIVQACQMTGADDFISRMPEKYQTILGEFGATLSGGQRQRLAIARAIVNAPPLLILDESTAGLDPVSETQLLDKLLWHRRGKTTILISHRPQVITQTEWIVFLDQGQFIRQGSLTDLQNTVGEHLDFLMI